VLRVPALTPNIAQIKENLLEPLTEGLVVHFWAPFILETSFLYVLGVTTSHKEPVDWEDSPFLHKPPSLYTEGQQASKPKDDPWGGGAKRGLVLHWQGKNLGT
jgi:hypothetical protein